MSCAKISSVTSSSTVRQDMRSTLFDSFAAISFATIVPGCGSVKRNVLSVMHGSKTKLWPWKLSMNRFGSINNIRLHASTAVSRQA